MATATGPLPIKHRNGEIMPLAMDAVEVFKGTAAAVVSGTGYATPLLPANTTHRFVGVFTESYDNSGGSAGDHWTMVVKTGAVAFNQTGTTITLANCNQLVYFSDDNTVTLTAGATWAGHVTAVDSNGTVWVDIANAVRYTSQSSSGPTPLAGVEQRINALSAVQRYAIGTKKVTDDGRIFRYAKAGTGGLQSEFAAVQPLAAVVSAVAPTQASGAGAIGSTTLTVTVGASAGIAGDGAVAANALVGGYIWIGNGTSQHPQCRCITANTVVASGGGTSLVTFDEALTTAVTESVTHVEAFFSPYAYVTSGNVTNSAYVSAVGMPAITCSAADYVWIQTHGPVWITSDGLTGEAANGRDLFFQTNGSIVAASSTTYTCRQRAGYAMDKSASNASNSPCCFLTLE